MSATSLKQAATGKVEAKGPMSTKDFSAFMGKFKTNIEAVLPKHLTAERMLSLANTAYSSSPKLAECDPMSIVSSVVTAARMGLEIGIDGQGYVVPYKQSKKVGNKWESKMLAQFIPGWKGLVDLVNRAGKGTVYTGVIFKDQKYTFIDGARRDLVIHNETDLDDAEDITHAYAIGWVKGSDLPIIELWRVSKLQKHRDKYNKVGDSHYSFRDWEMYARKIPLLQVIKYMPKSIELQMAYQAAEAQESGGRATIEGDFVQIDMNDEPKPNPTNVDQETGEISEGAPAQNNDGQLFEGTTAEVIEKRMNAAFVTKDIEVLDLAADDIRSLPEAEQARLNGVYKELKEKLAK